jgi:hypothetical protein
MDTKYCSYNVLSAKGKRKYNRRSCKKTSNSAENSDLCEVLNKRCGLKENHDRRVYRQTHSKKLSRNNRVKSVQRKPDDTKRPVVVAKEAPRKVEPRPVVVAKEAPRKVEQRPVVVAKEAPVAIKELRSSKSQDTKEYKRIVNELQRYGKSRAYYSNADFVNTGSRWQAEEDKKKYDDEVQLFEEIKQQYGSDIINITTTKSPEDSRLDWIDTFISVNPTMKDKFDSMV